MNYLWEDFNVDGVLKLQVIALWPDVQEKRIKMFATGIYKEDVHKHVIMGNGTEY